MSLCELRPAWPGVEEMMAKIEYTTTTLSEEEFLTLLLKTQRFLYFESVGYVRSFYLFDGNILEATTSRSGNAYALLTQVRSKERVKLIPEKKGRR